MALVLCGVLACGTALAPSLTLARSGARGARRAAAAEPHAPSGPQLVSGASAYAAPQGADADGESEPESAAASEDPLLRNGLLSPLCRLSAGEISSGAAANCRTSGFVAASAPSEDYSFDTNIDTTFGVNIDALLQDYVVRPIWMALVWLVHALLVALEWAYSLDLLRGPLADGLGPALRAAQAQFTRPWLASGLAVAAVLLAYHGLVRRRVAQTLGEALMMLAMIAAAMLVIADPEGTIGGLSQLADTASVGTFGAVAQGSAARPYRALAESMHELYAASIEAPWCFMEFGDVGWCDQPARLDPRLEKAAVRIAASIEGKVRSGSQSGVSAEVLAHRAQLLRAARTNGQIFLALPANGPLRNSVKESTSLLYVLCGGGEDATECRGPTAAEAEFRANSGTLPRMGGVLLIALSVLGMLLLIGFIAVRLIEAAILSLLLLLLAPVAALAPTLGEAGRAAFQKWAAHLLGTVSAKLLWSALLAALLATLRIVLALEGLGWLVQWLLSGALWWGVFLRRHMLLESAARGGGMQGARQTRLARVGEDALVLYGLKAAKSVWRRTSSKRSQREERPPQQQQPDSGVPGALRELKELGNATRRPVHGKDGDRRAGQSSRPPRGGSSAQPPDAARETSQERSTRLRAAHEQALADGDVRRATSLRIRQERIDKQAKAGGGQVAKSVTAAPQFKRQAAEPAESRQAHAATRRDAVRSPRGTPGKAGAPADGAPKARDRSRSDRAARSTRAQVDRELATRKELRDPVMRDAYEVAQGRQRQLGWSWRKEQ
jgi:hypothetical protein